MPQVASGSSVWPCLGPTRLIWAPLTQEGTPSHGCRLPRRLACRRSPSPAGAPYQKPVLPVPFLTPPKVCRLPNPASEAGVLAGAAALLAALLRRRAAPARRLMVLAAASARALLAALIAWGARSGAAAACAEELARVYAAVAEHRVRQLGFPGFCVKGSWTLCACSQTGRMGPCPKSWSFGNSVCAGGRSALQHLLWWPGTAGALEDQHLVGHLRQGTVGMCRPQMVAGHFKTDAILAAAMHVQGLVTSHTYAVFLMDLQDRHPPGSQVGGRSAAGNAGHVLPPPAGGLHHSRSSAGRACGGRGRSG